MVLPMNPEKEDDLAGRAKIDRGRTARPGHRAADVLLWLVDLGLLAVILAVPFFMGGRQPLGQLVLVALAVGIAVCWCLRQSLAPKASWCRSPVDWLLLAGPILVGLQLVALPPWLLERLSPQVYETLSLWAPQDEPAASPGVWNTLSLTPAATRRSFVLLSALVLVLAVALQRVRRLEDVERLIRWIAYATVAVAVFGLLQHFTSNGKFFWFYQHVQARTNGAVNGPFANPNHFAQFLALGVGPLIWWVRQGRVGRRPAEWPDFAPAGRVDAHAVLVALALGILVFAGLMSRSRGGALAIFIAAGTCLVVLCRGGLVRPKTLLAGIGLGAFVLGGLFIHGYQPVAAELADFRSLETLDDEGAGRRRLWKADLLALADYPVAGTGAASHRDVIPIYFRDQNLERVEYTHAENSYVQAGLETGVPGALLVLAALGICVYCGVATMSRRLSPRACLALAALAAGLAASFLHAIADFIWYVPACLLPAGLMAACLLRIWQFAGRPGGEPPPAFWVPRAGWLGVAVWLTLVGGFALQDRLAVVRAEPSWHRFRLLEKAVPIGDLAESPPDTLEEMADALEGTIHWRPDHGRAHARLAQVHLAMFERSGDGGVCQYGVKGVRDAALASRFESREALDEWLGRAFPEGCEHLEAAWRHARLAVRHAPLEPEGYLFLANLAFFEGPASPGKEAYIEQALKVRPFDGIVRFEAGREALLAGDPAGAFEHWKEAYCAGPDAQRRLEEFLAGIMPAATFIEFFQPDAAALKRMSRHYATLDQPEELRTVEVHLAAALESRARSLEGPQAAETLREAATVHARLKQATDRLRCLENAVRADPSHFQARRMLGACLFEMGRYAEAEEQLRWCLQWRAADKSLRAELEAAVDRRLRMGSRSDEAPMR